MTIICCIRAREKTDFKDPMKPVSLGLQPICEKNFMFEMTASLLIENEGKTQRFLKMPSFLARSFGEGKNYLTEETGMAIMEWINRGERESIEVSKIKSEMLMACERGLNAVVEIWNTLTPELKQAIEPHKNICKEAALEYERQQKEIEDMGMNQDLSNAASKALKIRQVYKL
jgi:hypothetical protein